VVLIGSKTVPASLGEGHVPLPDAIVGADSDEWPECSNVLHMLLISTIDV